MVEQELLSSTSSDICEMWTRGGIVRTKGQPPLPFRMKTLIITRGRPILELEDACANGYSLVNYSGELLNDNVVTEKTRTLAAQRPNLALNVNKKTYRALAAETWMLACVSVALQLATLVFAALVTYKWQWSGGDDRSSWIACAMYLAGSLCVCAWLLWCARVIEAETEEHTFECAEDMKDDTIVVRLQRACKVGDQHFRSFAVFNPFGNPDIEGRERSESVSVQHRDSSCLHRSVHRPQSAPPVSHLGSLQWNTVRNLPSGMRAEGALP